MAITVKGYQKHLNGKLVTVHGYAADRNPLYPSLPPAHAPVHREIVARPGIEAVPGTFIQPSVTRGIGGKTAYLYQPGGPDRDLPTYRWRTTILPIHGAYRIPKKESGNPDGYINK